VHLTLVPYIGAAGELKTKPTQHSVQKLREIGIQPEILICRCDRPLDLSIKKKIALFSNVPADCVFTSQDVPTVYELPMRLHDEGLDDKIAEVLNIWSRSAALTQWERVVDKIKRPEQKVVIGFVGKYVHLVESYKSLNEALVHGGIDNDCRVGIRHIDSEELEHGAADSLLADVDGILVGPGFGERGTEGKITAARYAREHGVPYFGICLGLQIAVIEFARNVVGLRDANSTEFNESTAYPVIHMMPDQRGIVDKGATMRLGAYPCSLLAGTHAAQAYAQPEVSERHRHRFEVNNDYREMLQNAGLVLSGLSPDKRLVEIVELKNHPYFLGCQFHPEFKSRPFAPHPLFRRFIRAALEVRASERRRVPAGAPGVVGNHASA
jgi:CTP synthase